jgi:hypothetical protein
MLLLGLDAPLRLFECRTGHEVTVLLSGENGQDFSETNFANQ